VRQTAVRDLLTLVLQHPRLAHIAHDVEELKELDAPGIGLLVDVIHTVVESSGLTTAGLLERFRGHEHHRHLEKLAARAHVTGEDQGEQEFRACLGRLRWEFAKRKVEKLEAEISREIKEYGKASDAKRREHAEWTRHRERLKPGGRAAPTGQ
jgi:DNA primase